VPEKALDRMRRLYADSVRYVDTWLEAVLSRLDKSGLLDETLVIVTSDHGENLGESGMIGHALSLDERLLRVPLIAAGPGAEHLEDLRSLAELPTRVAQAAGLEHHPWQDRGLPAGMAVAQFDPPSDPIRGYQPWSPSGTSATMRRMRSSARPTPITCAVDGRWEARTARWGRGAVRSRRRPARASPYHRPGADARGGRGHRCAVCAKPSNIPRRSPRPAPRRPAPNRKRSRRLRTACVSSATCNGGRRAPGPPGSGSVDHRVRCAGSRAVWRGGC